MNMDTNNSLFYLIAITIFSISFFATCKKNECQGKNYLFKSEWIVKQEIDSINVGDTLTVKSIINALDYNSNQLIDLGNNSIIGTPMSIGALKGLGVINGAVDSFNFMQIKGNITTDITTNPKSIKQLLYKEYNGKYEFEFSIIAQKKRNICNRFTRCYIKKRNAKWL